MKNLRTLIGTTIIGGILFLIPLVFIVVVVGKAFQILKVFAKPLGRLIPFDSFAGLAKIEILTAGIMLACCFIAGMLARSPWGKRAHARIDGILLRLIPGYAWIKGITYGLHQEDSIQVLKPVLVTLDDQIQVAFEVDRTADYMVAVFVPGSPDPRSGTISYVTADRVRLLDASANSVLKICRNLGRNSCELLRANDIGNQPSGS